MPIAGHNIADVAAEAASFSINTETIAVAIKELDKCLKVTENSGALSAAMAAGAAGGTSGLRAFSSLHLHSIMHAAADGGIGDPEELKLNCAIAKGIMLKLEACLDAIQLSPSPQPQPCQGCGAAMTSQSLVCLACSSIRKRCGGDLHCCESGWESDRSRDPFQWAHTACASAWGWRNGGEIKSGRLWGKRSVSSCNMFSVRLFSPRGCPRRPQRNI
jgi:hypothetical protein